MIRDDYLIRDEATLRGLFPPTHELARRKSLAALDAHARDFIARSPFLAIGTRSGEGQADVSPRGDPCGFVKVLDDRTLLIPDRPGNNRLDTLANIIANPSLGLLFIVPGFDDSLRINGRAAISRDPELLAMLEVEGRQPRVAIVVTIEEVFLHCAKAFRRSRLWDPEARQDRKAMPSLVQMILEQVGEAPQDRDEQKRLDDKLEDDYRKGMY